MMVLGQAFEAGSIFFWCLVLVALIVGGFFLVIWVKKWVGQDEGANEQPFTLSDLRELHKQGKMTATEFERAKAAMLDLAKKQHDRRPPPQI